VQKASRGFTLIEVLIAGGLLTAICVGVAHLFVTASGVNAQARAITMATIAASEKTEQLQALPFDDDALALSPPGTLAADVDGYWDEPIVGYRRRWSVEPLPSYPASAVVVHVVVSRSGGGQLSRLVSIKARKGMPR
jgi:type II secretory pathway pseudopilin PulG